jgi:hypothetical protein
MPFVLFWKTEELRIVKIEPWPTTRPFTIPSNRTIINAADYEPGGCGRADPGCTLRNVRVFDKHETGSSLIHLNSKTGEPTDRNVLDSQLCSTEESNPVKAVSSAID